MYSPGYNHCPLYTFHLLLGLCCSFVQSVSLHTGIWDEHLSQWPPQLWHRLQTKYETISIIFREKQLTNYVLSSVFSQNRSKTVKISSTVPLNYFTLQLYFIQEVKTSCVSLLMKHMAYRKARGVLHCYDLYRHLFEIYVKVGWVWPYCYWNTVWLFVEQNITTVW